MTSEMSSSLSRIVTDWSMVLEAQQNTDAPEAQEARRQLLERYHRAVLRYLQRKLPQYEAEMLASDFALAVLDCERILSKADRQHGMFRRYLQRVLGNWVIDKFRKDKRRRNKEIAVEVEVGVEDPPVQESAEEIALKTSVQQLLDVSLAELLKALRGSSLKQWRSQLLDRTLNLLRDQEAAGGPPYHTLLCLKDEQPELGGQDLADALSARVGRTISAANVRQMIHRSRERYAELLIEQLAGSLEQATKERPNAASLEEKLIEMELLNAYVREALAQYATTRGE